MSDTMNTRKASDFDDAYRCALILIDRVDEPTSSDVIRAMHQVIDMPVFEAYNASHINRDLLRCALLDQYNL